MSERNGSNLLTKLVLTALIPMLVAAVTFGIVRSDVNHNKEDIQRIEKRMDAQYQAIDAKLDRLLRRE